MSFRSTITRTAALAVLVNLLLLPAAWAISVGNGAGPSVETSYDLQFFAGLPFWVIAEDPNAEVPVPVSLDPTAGSWLKTLNVPGEVFTEGAIAVIVEALAVDGDTPWTDWHEEILTPGWEWIEYNLSGTDFPFVTELGTSNPVPGLSFSLSPTNLDFFFDPIQPGAGIGIGKAIQFVGIDSTNPDEIASGTIRLAEYPTASAIPEPSTIVLMGLGLVGLGYAGRRKLMS